LKVDSCYVAFDTLLEKGFFKLFEDFRESPSLLQTQVQKLRHNLYDSGVIQNRKMEAVPHKKFSIAMRLDALFNDKWQ
jgi:hypothetical protein